jgi:alkaline phosphatase
VAPSFVLIACVTPPCPPSNVPTASKPINQNVTITPVRLAVTDPGFSRSPKNVVFFLADGTAPEAWTLTRWVMARPLGVDEILTGAIRTYGADSLITDSAPGATAYATGRKGTDKAISIGAFRTTVDTVESNTASAYVPLPTLLEGAKVNGFATGLVATSNVQHASPAAFSAHAVSREEYNEIAEQQVYQNIDVVLSGGLRHLLPKGNGVGVRDDGEDLSAVLKSRGYRVVTTKSELVSAAKGPLWGLFAPNDLAYDIDRERDAPDQPSLADMTEEALERLSATPRGKETGFFLFVEGSKIDWAAHDNDPVGILSEVRAFDEAVKRALDFAKTHPRTQVVVVSDHATGGLSIGSYSDPNYSRTDEAKVVTPLRRAKVTARRLNELLANVGPGNGVRSLLAEQWGIVDCSKNELDELNRLLEKKQSTITALTKMMSVRAHLGWTSNGHTGADVYLFAYGPEHPSGLVENVEIGRGIAGFLGFSLADLSQRLFIDLAGELTKEGYAVSLDQTDARNGKLVVTKGNRSASLPFAKNLVLIGEQAIPLEGVVVYIEPLHRVFGPAEAVTVIRRELQ